jgi:tetratricopeptide (TPR) repeat protein
MKRVVQSRISSFLIIIFCASLSTCLIAVKAVAAPILIPGVKEPDEMRVEPLPKSNPSAPLRMLGEAFGLPNSKEPRVLLPALDQILAQYPEFSDGYVTRAFTLCDGGDRSAVGAIMADFDRALKFLVTSETGKGSIVALRSARAKMEYVKGEYAVAIDDLEGAVRANLTKALEFTNSGAVKPEKTASICVWSQSDMDALVHHFPSDYRSYLFRGLYFGFFVTWDEDSFDPAINDLNRAAELNRKSALPLLFKAELLSKSKFFKRLNMSELERDKLGYELVSAYEKALTIDPTLLPALVSLADAHHQLKRFQEAIVSYTKILSIDAQDAGSYNDRGLAKMELGDKYGAIDDLSSAIKLKKRELMNYHSYENRADAYMKTQQWDLAIRDLSTAISLLVGGSLAIMNIDQFRAIYPEYASASNETVARKLNQTFYPNMTYEGFEGLFLKERGQIDPSFVIGELYAKRSDAYLKKGDWHRAFVEFQRVSKGFPHLAGVVDRWREIDQTIDRRRYIDLGSFDDSHSDSIKFWVKEISRIRRLQRTLFAVSF